MVVLIDHYNIHGQYLIFSNYVSIAQLIISLKYNSVVKNRSQGSKYVAFFPMKESK